MTHQPSQTPTAREVIPSPMQSLWAHQAQAIEFATSRPGSLLAIGMGGRPGGKTRTAIEVAECDQAQRVLVLCPVAVTGMWREQFQQWSPRTWEAWSGRVMGARGPLRNPSVARRAEAALKAYTDAIKLDRPFLCTINYEAAWQGNLAQFTLGTDWDLVILDESHRIKSPSGKQAKHAARVAHKCRGRGGRAVLLTGTPMPHTPLDVWTQMLAIDSGATLGTSYSRFCRQWGAAEEFYAPGGVQRTKYTGVLEHKRTAFARALAPHMFQVTQEDLDRMLDLPDAVDETRVCQLEPATRAAYDLMQKDLLAELDGAEIEAANAMVLTNKLAQLSGGFCKTPDGRVVHAVNPPEKAKLLADVLTDIPAGDPVVVFARFHADLDAISKVAAITGRRYGELSGRRKDGVTDGGKFQPGVTLLGAQLQSGGVGIDLTAAHVCVFYSLDFKLAEYLQSRKRVHRPGQHRLVTYIHLVADQTIDRAVIGALAKREDAVKAALKTIREQHHA